MPSDIVLPSGNEDALIKMAKYLGYSTLYLLYDKGDIPKLVNHDAGITVHTAMVVPPKDVAQARKRVGLVICHSAEDDRAVVEGAKPDAILGFELRQRKDFLNARNSGLNHVLCNIMRQNNVALALSLKAILHPKIPREELMGRIIQNIVLCRKYGVHVILGSFAQSTCQMRSPHDIIAFCRFIGMDGKEAKLSLDY